MILHRLNRWPVSGAWANDWGFWIFILDPVIKIPRNVNNIPLSLVPSTLNFEYIYEAPMAQFLPIIQ